MTPQFWGVFLPAPDAQDTSAMVAANRYTVDLFEVGGGVARVFEGGDRLEIALAIYQSTLVKHPDKLVMLCDQSLVLARSDQRPGVPDGITLLKRGVSLSAVAVMLYSPTPGQCLGADAMAHAC